MSLLERQVLHLDVAAFAVAVARVVDPRLRGRPVAVAPPVVRAVVGTASAEARREGVRPGMPLQDARRLCRGLVVLPPDDGLCGRATQAVLEVAGRFAPVVEPGPLGRAWLDVTGTGRLFGPPIDLAARLQRELRGSLRLDAAMGVAVNKLVSRVAADLIEPVGLRDVPVGDEAPFLAPLGVGRLPGVGSAVFRGLRALNLRLVGQVAALEVEHLLLAFGRFGALLHQRARGIDPRPVQPPVREPEVRREAVLPEDTNDREALRGALRGLAEDAARELRLRGMSAGRLELEIRYTDARAERGRATLPAPAALDAELWRAADALFSRTCSRRVRVRELRLRAAGLARRQVQLGLFDDDEHRRDAALTAALDRIRTRHGEGAVRSGLQLGRGAVTSADTTAGEAAA
jgi:DNA polymerase IV